MSSIMYRELSNEVLGAAFTVHNEIGCGLLESAYEAGMVIEFRRRGLSIERQKKYQLHYKGELAGVYYADIVVENRIIVELKSVDRLTGVMKAQVINYLKVSGIRVGYLMNFRNSRVEWERVVA